MKKDKAEREEIVQKEIQRVKKPYYDIKMAEKWENENRLRPDLDMQVCCPKCAADYPIWQALPQWDLPAVSWGNNGIVMTVNLTSKWIVYFNWH